MKSLVILLAVGLLLVMGCGEAQQAEPVEEVIEEVEEIEEIVVTPMMDPGNLTEFRGQNGDELFFWVTGDGMGSVWGTDIYTDDSYLSASVVHAGVLEDGETGAVMVTILPGEDEYTGTERNDVISWDYGEWSGSYIVEALPAHVIAEEGVMGDPGNLTEYRGLDGDVFEFEVTGDAWGSLWGTDIYTDDSSLAAAAVHAGVLEDGETGIVTVTILPGEEAYAGSERNGIESWDYPEWSGSYSVE